MIVIAMITTTSITTVIVMSITRILLISAECSNKDYAKMICEYNYRDNVTIKEEAKAQETDPRRPRRKLNRKSCFETDTPPPPSAPSHQDLYWSCN